VARLRPVSHEDRLTLVEHLDELRTRLVIAGGAFVAAFALCMWQNHLLLDVANHPLPARCGQTDPCVPITFGVSEPFMTTVTVAAYTALVISLPVILYQLYAYVLPALTPSERGVAFPLLLLIPFLFVCGVVFGYFIVLPAAVKFLLNFNSDQFNIQVRARDYYSFFAITLVALGILFQVPVVILAMTRLGIVTPKQLSANRRYAIVIIAVVAMLLPGTDPVTMLISMVPLLVLFEGSVLLARAFGQPAPESPAQVSGEPSTEPPG
jgi:Tat protein translocase TatC